MPRIASQRDRLLCVLAHEQRLIGDADLESAVQAWRANPSQLLVEALASFGRIPPDKIAALEATADRPGDRAAAAKISTAALPAAVEKLLAKGMSDVALATPRQYETRPMESRSVSEAGSTSAPMTTGERFDVLQVLAQGGLGIVFLARDQEIERTVALKQIKSQWADDENSRARFLLEARVTGRLEHPGIVPIYALGADATGRPYYAMRLIRGESLLDVIDRFHGVQASHTPISVRMVELRKLLQRFLDVCNAVDYAHSKGVIHRDLKPSNIMVGKFGETLVVDWGLAKVIGSDEDVALTTRMVRTHEANDDPASTRLGAAVGTPAYMSPEQAAGRHNELGPATDVYSLGATLYHLLTGWLPHADDEDVAVMIAKVGQNTIVSPRVRANWLPRPLESICLKALAATPADRYVSARALSDDIERWLSDEPCGHSEGWSERMFRWMRNHRTLATSLAVAYLMAAAAIVIGVIGWNHLQLKQRANDPADASSQSSLPR